MMKDRKKDFYDNLYDIAHEYEDELYDLWRGSTEIKKAKPEKKQTKPKRRQRKTHRLSRSDGWVYLVEGAGLFKIGITIDLDKRMEGLQAQSPVRIRLIHAFKSRRYREVEAYLHKVFENTRKHYEWFALFDSDVIQIKDIGDYEYDDMDLE